MNLQKRIQQSAAELSKLLSQAERKHQRFLKLRDREIMHKHYCPKRLFCEELLKPGDIYSTDGLPIGFSIVVPTNAGRDGLVADLATRRRQEARVRSVAQDIARAVRDQSNPVAIPLDNGKSFNPLDKGDILARAVATVDGLLPAISLFGISSKQSKTSSKLRNTITRIICDVVEDIHCKLYAFLEINGTKAFIEDPACKIVFNVEISRDGYKLCDKVHYMVKAD